MFYSLKFPLIFEHRFNNFYQSTVVTKSSNLGTQKVL